MAVNERMLLKNARVKKMNKNIKMNKNKKSDVLVLAQEIKFAKILAGNDKKLRDKVLKSLKKWFEYRSKSSHVFVDDDFLRLWKGLFYCMWMSDKPLVQEELAENISKLIHSFSNCEDSIKFFKCFLQTMSQEWFGLDQLRLDKFLMLVRRLLRQALTALHNGKWNSSHLELFGDAFENTVLKNSSSLGLIMHLSEIYLEEIAKVSGGHVPQTAVTALLRPFVSYLSQCSDERPIRHVCKNVFRMLLHQSEAGQDYQDRFDAWKEQGFPGGSIDCMQKVSESDDENEEENNDDQDMADSSEAHLADTESPPKDPRAGKVDVVLPQIDFDPVAISQMLLSYRFNKDTNTKSRKALNRLADEYKQMSEGKFPLGVKQVRVLSEEDAKPVSLKKMAKKLIKFETKLYSDSSKNRKKKKLKKRKHESLGEENGEKNKCDREPLPTKKAKISKLLNRSNSADLSMNLKKDSHKRKVVNDDHINNSEVVQHPAKKSKRRSSGVWHVEEIQENVTDTDIRSALNTSQSKIQINSPTKTIVAVVKSPPNKSKGLLCKTLNHSRSELKSPSTPDMFVENNEWNEPLKEGETEIYLPSQKFRVKMANLAEANGVSLNTFMTTSAAKSVQKLKSPSLVLNPFASPETSPKVKNSPTVIDKIPSKKSKMNGIFTPSPSTLKKNSVKSTSKKSPKIPLVTTPNSEKRVKIMLNQNRSQDTKQYQQQLKSSPQIPFDAARQPSKTLLKPNLVPSPINPFYKNMIGISI